MADKYQGSTYPQAPAIGFSQKDSEHGLESDSREVRRKKQIMYGFYFIVFVIFQTGVVAIFTLTIMKVRTPKFRVQTATINSFSVGTPASPAFNLSMDARVSIKNANFGKFKYDNTTMYFFYKGNPVGEATVLKSSVGWRSTKKFDVVVKLSSANLPSSVNGELGTVLGSDGVLQLTSEANLQGKVALTFIFKKEKAPRMNCTMDVAVKIQQLSNIVC